MAEAKFMTSEPLPMKDDDTLKVLNWHLLKGGLKVPNLEGVTDIDQIIKAGFQQINGNYDAVQRNILDMLQGNDSVAKIVTPAPK